MDLVTSPFSAAQLIPAGSDVASVRFDGRTLVVIVAHVPMESGNFLGLRIVFREASAFRLLDEADLASCWMAKGFVPGHHVLSVLSGGWNDEESVRQGYCLKRREWLVVTGNRCLSVFASDEPMVEEGEFVDD